MEICTTDGCNCNPGPKELVGDSGMCLKCHRVDMDDKTEDSPRYDPIWHHTKVNPKQFARPTELRLEGMHESK